MLPFLQESELNKHNELVTVEKGQTLSFLAQKYYHTVNTTLVALILDFNPEITNANLIMVDQKIKIPKMTEELLIMLSTDHTYKIHLGTFKNPKFVRFYKDESALKGKAIEIFPRKVSPQDTWYRVVAGPFGNKEECLEVIDQFKEKGLLPVFGGILKME
jgi:LysM repeat protein